MRRLAAWMLALSLAGCGGERDGTRDAFQVALLTTGPVSDQGWNESAHDGLRRIEAELGASVTTVESLEKNQFEENLREFGSRGYDLVFGHAYEFQDATLRVARDFPRTTFVVIAGNESASNVGSVHFKLEDATYVLGALAAHVSTSGVAGLVGGEEIPSLVPGFQGFENGARSVDPAFRVITKYVGNWHDVALAREHAEALIEAGAQFLFQNADKAGLGVFQAASEHDGVWAFGSNRDQNDVIPGAVFASAVIDVPVAYMGIAREVKERTYRPSAKQMGVREGVVRVVMNPEAASTLAPDVARSVAELGAQVASGEIDVLAAP